MIPLFLHNGRRALQGAHALQRVSGARLISVFAVMILHDLRESIFRLHNHEFCNDFPLCSLSLQMVEELRKAPRPAAGIGSSALSDAFVDFLHSSLAWSIFLCLVLHKKLCMLSVQRHTSVPGVPFFYVTQKRT